MPLTQLWVHVRTSITGRGQLDAQSNSGRKRESFILSSFHENELKEYSWIFLVKSSHLFCFREEVHHSDSGDGVRNHADL